MGLFVGISIFVVVFLVFTTFKYYMKKDDDYFEKNKKIGKAIIKRYDMQDDSLEMYVSLIGDTSSHFYLCEDTLDELTNPVGTEIGVYYVYKDTLVGKMARIKVIGYEDKYQKYLLPAFTAFQIISVGFILYFVYKMIFA